jgi:F-type H+-transporting ATPase subunit a
MSSPVISLAAEPIFQLAGVPVTNSMLTALLVSGSLVIVAVLLRLRLKQVPRAFQSTFELLYAFFVQTAERVTGNPRLARDLFPLVTTSFLFILVSNWSGLLPVMGSVGIHESHHGLVPLLRAPTSDLNTVIALALCSVVYVQALAIKYRGIRSYLHGFFNFSSPISFFTGLIELLSEGMRIISYSFRLFGNVFAGEVLIATVLFLTMTLVPLVPVVPLPFYGLELFVGFVQALVFAFLTIVFAGIAAASHDSHPKAAASK